MIETLFLLLFAYGVSRVLWRVPAWAFTQCETPSAVQRVIRRIVLLALVIALLSLSQIGGPRNIAVIQTLIICLPVALAFVVPVAIGALALVFWIGAELLGPPLAGVRRLIEMPGRLARDARVAQREREEAWRRRRNEAESRRLEQAATDRSQEVEQGRRNEVAAAQAEVLCFYAEHIEDLIDAHPKGLFRATVRSRFAPDLGPLEAWRTAREIITELQPIIVASRRRRRNRARIRREQLLKRRRIDEQIAALESQIVRLRSSPLDPDIASDEIQSLERRIEELQSELRSLD